MLGFEKIRQVLRQSSLSYGIKPARWRASGTTGGPRVTPMPPTANKWSSGVMPHMTRSMRGGSSEAGVPASLGRVQID
jgi:hypothetical protein